MSICWGVKSTLYTTGGMLLCIVVKFELDTRYGIRGYKKEGCFVPFFGRLSYFVCNDLSVKHTQHKIWGSRGIRHTRQGTQDMVYKIWYTRGIRQGFQVLP